MIAIGYIAKQKTYMPDFNA